MLADIEMEKN